MTTNIDELYKEILELPDESKAILAEQIVEYLETHVVMAEVQVVSEERRSLAERLKDIIGIAPDLPEDMSLNHDHYLHGMPKK